MINEGNNSVAEIDLDATNDSDLVELGGYHAYNNFDDIDELTVNGKEFLIIDTIYNPESGFKALTVENYQSKEISVVYVGSKPNVQDWILTNPMLLSDTPPQQIQDAIDYYDWVNDNVGEVSSINDDVTDSQCKVPDKRCALLKNDLVR